MKISRSWAIPGRRKEIKPRWKRCAQSTDHQLGEALGKKYVEKYFPPQAKARAQEMVKNILAAMHDTIEGLQWMDADTKKRALEKLSTFNPKIGYPDKWKDYSSIKIGRDSYWDNRWPRRDGMSLMIPGAHIGKPTDRGRWGMTPPTSNAYYNPLLNEIVFPAGILQPPAFDMSAVDAVNYGSIGVVIGHEISHGFDDQGAKFDAQGRLNNWWTAGDIKRFDSALPAWCASLMITTLSRTYITTVSSCWVKALATWPAQRSPILLSRRHSKQHPARPRRVHA